MFPFSGVWGIKGFVVFLCSLFIELVLLLWFLCFVGLVGAKFSSFLNPRQGKTQLNIWCLCRFVLGVTSLILSNPFPILFIQHSRLVFHPFLHLILCISSWQLQIWNALRMQQPKHNIQTKTTNMWMKPWIYNSSVPFGVGPQPQGVFSRLSPSFSLVAQCEGDHATNENRSNK